MEFNYLVNQNCVELMNSMNENSIDLTITSPPYDQLRNYEGYDFDFKSVAEGLYKVTKQGGIVVWVVGDKIKNGNKNNPGFPFVGVCLCSNSILSKILLAGFQS